MRTIIARCLGLCRSVIRVVSPEMPMQYIVPHNPDWKARFEHIAASIADPLPPGCRIHHVGSTSIPGMPGKDVINIDIECPAGSMSAVIGALGGLGYEHEGDKGITGREAFRTAPGSQDAEPPDHHLYACECGAFELRRHLAFRDYLKSHPDRAQWLAEQKVAVDSRVRHHCLDAPLLLVSIQLQVYRWKAREPRKQTGLFLRAAHTHGSGVVAQNDMDTRTRFA